MQQGSQNFYMWVQIHSITDLKGTDQASELKIVVGQDEQYVAIDSDYLEKQTLDLVFSCKANDSILFQLLTRNKAEFSNFPLTKIINLPNINHQLEIELIDKKLADQTNVIKCTRTLIASIRVIAGKIGVLEISRMSAELERDTELVGQMDPYVRMSVEGQQYSTSVSQDKGKYPSWNKKFSIPITQSTSTMKINVYDEDLTYDDLIGQREIVLIKQGFLNPGTRTHNKPIYLYFGKQKSGKLLIETRFTPHTN